MTAILIARREQRSVIGGRACLAADTRYRLTPWKQLVHHDHARDTL